MKKPKEEEGRFEDEVLDTMAKARRYVRLDLAATLRAEFSDVDVGSHWEVNQRGMAEHELRRLKKAVKQVLKMLER